MTDRDYNHSRPLDAHRWSNYSEVNPFINEIYNNHIKDVSENANIQKKHLKLVLLDLFIAWIDDPELNIGVHMHEGAYSDGTVFNKGKSRYNELNIKKKEIEIKTGKKINIVAISAKNKNKKRKFKINKKIFYYLNISFFLDL